MFVFIFALSLAIFGHSDAQQLANNPLPHPYLGCPRMQFWGTASECHGLYDSVDDGGWFAQEEGVDRVITWSDGKFKCCDSSSYSSDYSCSSSFDSGADLATCVYADNYCYSMEVTSVDTGASQCVGTFDQTSDRTWKHQKDASITLGIAGRDNEGRIQFNCLDNEAVVGQVEDYTCKGPDSFDIPEPLTYGLNNLLGEDTFVIGGDELKDGSFFKAFKMSTLSNGDEWLKVWVLSPQPLPRDEVVVVPMVSYKDKEFTIAQLKDVQHATFKIRLVSSCSEPHGSEDVQIVMMTIGEHSGTNGQLAIAGRKTINGGVWTDVAFSSSFPESPAAFAHVQEIITGPTGSDEGAVGAKHDRTGTTKFSVGLESGGKQVMGTSKSYEASVGYIAVASLGLKEGLFVPYTHHSYASHPKVELNHIELTYDFPSSFNSTPVVLGCTQTSNGDDELNSRLVLSSPSSMVFRVKEDQCNGENGSHDLEEEFGVLAVGDKIEPVCKPDDYALEVMYIQEMSWSFDDAATGEGRFAMVKADVPKLFDELSALYGSVKVGHLDFIDKPVEPLGQPQADHCSWQYHGVTPWTDVKTTLESNLASAFFGSGRDQIENQLDAMIMAALNGGFSSSDRDENGRTILRVAMIVTHKVWHEAGDFSEGAKYEADGTYQCEAHDYPTREQLKAALEKIGVHPIFLLTDASVEAAYLELLNDVGGNLRGEVGVVKDDLLAAAQSAFDSLCNNH